MSRWLNAHAMWGAEETIRLNLFPLLSRSCLYYFPAPPTPRKASSYTIDLCSRRLLRGACPQNYGKKTGGGIQPNATCSKKRATSFFLSLRGIRKISGARWRNYGYCGWIENKNKLLEGKKGIKLNFFETNLYFCANCVFRKPRILETLCRQKKPK